jgi:uncharacterized protein GlcG (DUF336 family)
VSRALNLQPNHFLPDAARNLAPSSGIKENHIMIKTSVGLAALALACAATTVANAQLVTTKQLSVEMAVAIATTAVATCKAQGYNVSVHVIGNMGEVLVALRGDNTGPHTMENSMRKALTSRGQRIPSGQFAENVAKTPNAGGLRLGNSIPARGALPIKVGNDTIGAAGASGAPGGDKDEACIQAGIDKVAGDLK